jgi:hypothetical protein
VLTSPRHKCSEVGWRRRRCWGAAAIGSPQHRRRRTRSTRSGRRRRMVQGAAVRAHCPGRGAERPGAARSPAPPATPIDSRAGVARVASNRRRIAAASAAAAAATFASFSWELSGDATPSRRRRGARKASAPNRLVPEACRRPPPYCPLTILYKSVAYLEQPNNSSPQADGKAAAEQQVAKSFKFGTF